jgi:hypothetical protein
VVDVSAAGYRQGSPPLVCSDNVTLRVNCDCDSIPGPVTTTTTTTSTTPTTTTTTSTTPTSTTTSTTTRPGTTTTTTTTTRRPGDGGRGGCAGLIWAAVIALATGLVLLIFHTCLGPAGTYAFAAGWILIALYGVLMAIFGVLRWLGICDQSLCDIARIHMSILGPLAAVLALVAVLVPCIWQPGYWMFLGVLGAWSSVAARCAWRRQ